MTDLQSLVDSRLDHALERWRELRLAEHSVKGYHTVPLRRGRFVLAMADLAAARKLQRETDQ